MTTEEKIEVMEAAVNGKRIQRFEDGEWKDCDEPYWNWASYEYRIKPEEVYRPYKNTDELIKDFVPGWDERYVPLIWVKSKEFSTKYMLTGFRGDSVVIGSSIETLEDLFRDYVLLDDSPCGKKVSKDA